MDSILVSRFSADDMDESNQPANYQSEPEDDSSDATNSRRSGIRSYDRYDTDETLSANDLGDEHCANLEGLILNLRANSPDFSRLELDDPVEGVSSLVGAIMVNKTVRDVEVHIEALDSLTRQDQCCLADAICRLPELRSLLVYKNSSIFLEPLSRHQPFLLAHLRLRKMDICKPSSVDNLVYALKHFPNLRSLDVGFEARDTDEVVCALNHIKSFFANLVNLRVDYKVLRARDQFTLDDRVVSVITQAIQDSLTLKSLSLPPFGCTDQCHTTLIDMLHQNTILDRIDYWVRVCNLYYPDDNASIDHLLHLNRTGVRRLLKKQGGITPDQLMKQLALHGDDLECIYHLFISDPSLLPKLQGVGRP